MINPFKKKSSITGSTYLYGDLDISHMSIKERLCFRLGAVKGKTDAYESLANQAATPGSELSSAPLLRFVLGQLEKVQSESEELDTLAREAAEHFGVEVDED